MALFQVPNYAFKLPWFIYDIGNRQLITSPTVPGDISDSKQPVISEVPIPGLNYQPVQNPGNGNRKISFTIPIVNRNNTIGNSILIQQLSALRNQTSKLQKNFKKQFIPNPQVLYYWGVGSVPLVYFVSKMDFTHRGNWANQLGQPQFSDANIELILDEKNPVNKAEEMFREISLITGSAVFPVINTVDTLNGRQF